MLGESGEKTPSGGGVETLKTPLSSHEAQPLLVIHVDVENILILSSRYAKDAASAARGELLDTSARRFASHVLAEAAWGAIAPESGEWKAVSPRHSKCKRR